MEIDKKQLRELLLYLWGFAEKARADLIAHQAAILFLKAAGQAQGFDQFLEETRQNPSPVLLAKNQEVRDTIERLLTEEKPDDTLEFLRNWKHEGPIQ
jgi:hypothetical protein